LLLSQGSRCCPAATRWASTPREPRDLGRVARRNCWVRVGEAGPGVAETRERLSSAGEEEEDVRSQLCGQESTQTLAIPQSSTVG